MVLDGGSKIDQSCIPGFKCRSNGYAIFCGRFGIGELELQITWTSGCNRIFNLPCTDAGLKTSMVQAPFTRKGVFWCLYFDTFRHQRLA